jgi:hypothetical protein
MTERFPDGACPFEDHDCGHLTGASWLSDEAMEPQAVAVEQHPEGEPELDAPHHVHDLWVVLGLEDD